MLIPIEWLRDFVELPEPPEALAERLTLAGNEVEDVRDSVLGPVLHLKLTPNRGDLLAVRGVGRETAAVYGLPVRDVAFRLTAGGPPESRVRVEVQAPDLCPRYVARVIRGVRIGPSPDWIRRRLEAAGLRSINNVVDVTNYVMLEMGQPLHAFDLDLLVEERIIVRRALPGETITTIDGTVIELEPEMLVIADGAVPVALAGVMGGRETEIHEHTQNVLLESACFDPTSVRRTSRRTGVSTPSSYRFERGVDPNGVRLAADRAAQLIVELAGGFVSETAFDLYPHPVEPRTIRFRPERCRSLLGAEVCDADQQRYLERLGLVVEQESADWWLVTVPTFRRDLTLEEDLIEEVGRLHGYDRLPETLPSGAAGPGRRSALESLVRRVREQMLAQGCYEAVTNTLVSSAFLARTRLEVSPAWPVASSPEHPEHPGPVPVRNPLSEEFDTLRPSLLPGLLQAAQHNVRHAIPDVFLFECGFGHLRFDGGLPRDRLLVAGLMLGSRWSRVWNADRSLAADFYTVKGAVETLASALGLGEVSAERACHPAFHPGRSAWLLVGEERLGIAGELHPEVAAALDLPRGVYLFELDGELLLRRATEERRYRPPSRFPSAFRDIAVVVDRTVPAAAVERVVREALGEWARSVRLFDVYTGRPLAEGKVSLAYALELGAPDRTLTDAEVDARIEAVRQRLREAFGADFRA